jgi:hypothetical protein
LSSGPGWKVEGYNDGSGRVTSDKQRELIRASGLFDPEYYRKTYADALDSGADPLDHFLEVGLERGYQPSAAFDPVLYRLTVPECGDANPVLHRIASSKNFSAPPLSEMFPQVTGKLPHIKGSPDLQLKRNRAYARGAADTRELPLVAEGRTYTLRVPEPQALLDRFHADRPFAYARLPHGFWDSLWQVETAEESLSRDPRARGLPAEQRAALATRLCDARYAFSGAFAPLFLDEVRASIPMHAANPDFLRAISLVGYPTFRDVVIGDQVTPRTTALRRLVAAHFRPEEPLYDGLTWKRLLISGHLKHLPALCRERPVVLVANRHFSDLKARWKLEHFQHVLIPPVRSEWQRQDLLARTRAAMTAALAAGGRPPVVLTQCGGSLAFWLIARLFAEFPGAFYVDLGQALDGWFFDITELRVYRWMKVYTRAVITHCALEPYYRALKGAEYEAWFASLP